MKKKIGILGTGAIGKTLARHFAAAGHPVYISNSRGPESLRELSQTLGSNVTAVSSNDAIEKADIVILSIPWAKLENATKTFTSFNSKIVIDTTNHILSVSPEFKLADIGSRASSEIVSSLLPGARVVKAFNTLYYKELEASPIEDAGNRVIVVSGNDNEAKAEVKELISSLEFWPLDIGDTEAGRKLQQPGGVLSSINLIRKKTA